MASDVSAPDCGVLGPLRECRHLFLVDAAYVDAGVDGDGKDGNEKDEGEKETMERTAAAAANRSVVGARGF